MDGGYNNYNSFGGGGGGFMAGETNSPSGGKTDNRDNKTLRPVTVKQIADATSPYPEAPYQIDGAEVNNVLFVGQVRNISSQSTNITYKIDDGTGEIEVKKWVDSATGDSMDTDEKGPGDGKMEVVLNGYARVFGAIKSFANKRYIGAHSVRPMTNINELHCHLLEATAVHLFFTRGPPGGAGAGGNAAAGGDAVMGGAEDYGGGQNKALLSVSPLAKKIYHLLKTEPQDDAGMELQHIASKLNLPTMDVARAGEELLNAGIIFSTMNEHTWAILEY
ncbi:Nucleic acid-binding OB-fold [Penicillium argentinense]|uniref:Nucleic acid-binding OB-fold n=1 Tax=Penicillium argentinense TaxID=1131581 RepID=A0A9W9K9C1_9EURO|nr:Nucleic acid-binding OB-fold [Penicillium argentinense]KAJ5097919.1 Nucleic acid-binding OB-fold [Penicillium argentinense]